MHYQALLIKGEYCIYHLFVSARKDAIMLLSVTITLRVHKCFEKIAKYRITNAF